MSDDQLATNGSRVCAMGDTPVEVALTSGPSTRRARSGTPRRPACGGWTSPASGCTASTRSRATTAPGAPPGSRAAWSSTRPGEPVVASPEGLAVLDREHGRDGPARSDRAGQAREPRQRRQGRRPGTGLGRHDGLRQAAAQRGAVPGRRRQGDLCGRRPDDLQRARVRRAAGAALPRRHRPVRRRRLRPGPGRRAPSAVAGGSSTSARRRSGRTA